MPDLLRVENLRVELEVNQKKVQIVKGISFRIAKGEVFAIVGESGCGKTIATQGILKLFPYNIKAAVTGSVFFDGEDLLKKSEAELSRIWGSKIGIIFQDPINSLNPSMKIERQISEVLDNHKKLPAGEKKEIILDFLQKLGITSPESCLKKYPHQLSGGMCQRIMMAIALICGPRLLIADEPTTALDVTIQAQIVQLLQEFVENNSLSLILISHDLSLLANIADKVAVMYQGLILESGNIEEIINNPLHPYTKGLLAAVPDNWNFPSTQVSVPVPEGFSGTVVQGEGCVYLSSCPEAMNICQVRVPEEIALSHSRRISCWLTAPR
ncbi:MAG: ABC transporter ATP-binding protein [Peptococcaceae bacterium]|nr:ABC transporter ATP-binding protein [Peptococcaceae bacterium]